jgi:hypothetical protein
MGYGLVIGQGDGIWGKLPVLYDIKSSRVAHITSPILSHITCTVENLFSHCTAQYPPLATGYVAILNKRTTSSHQRSIRPSSSRQISSKHSSGYRHFCPSHASFIRISRHNTQPPRSRIHKERESHDERRTDVNSFDLMQDIRKFPNALNFAACSRIFGRCPSSIRQIYATEKWEPQSKLSWCIECITETEMRKEKQTGRTWSTFFGRSSPLWDEPFHQSVGRGRSSSQRRWRRFVRARRRWWLWSSRGTWHPWRRIEEQVQGSGGDKRQQISFRESAQLRLWWL